VNGAGGDGPLHLTAYNGHAETAKALLELGATPDGRFPHWTPLHATAIHGHAGDILVLPATDSPTPYHTRRSEGRDESASYTSVELCACTRDVDCRCRTWGGVRRDVTANPQPKKVGCLLVLSLHTGTCTGLSLAPASVCSPVRLSMASPTPVCRCGDGTTGGWGELGGYGWRRPYTFEDRRRQGTRGAGAGAETVRATQCHPTDVACQ
jgi:hypothetical protein